MILSNWVQKYNKYWYKTTALQRNYNYYLIFMIDWKYDKGNM